MSAIPLREAPLVRDNPDGSCAVKGCPNLAVRYRLTNQEGFLVHYCSGCEERAQELFGVAWSKE